MKRALSSSVMTTWSYSGFSSTICFMPSNRTGAGCMSFHVCQITYGTNCAEAHAAHEAGCHSVLASMRPDKVTHVTTRRVGYITASRRGLGLTLEPLTPCIATTHEVGFAGQDPQGLSRRLRGTLACITIAKLAPRRVQDPVKLSTTIV